MSFVWIYLFLFLFFGMLLIVPLKNVLKLIPFGLIGGFVVAVVVNISGTELGLWQFNTGLLFIRGVPLGILLSWIPPVVVFAYLINNSNEVVIIISYIFLFALFTAILTHLSVIIGYRDYLNWDVVFDFLLAAVIHSGLALYLKANLKLDISLI